MTPDAVLTSADLTCATLSAGLFCLTNAAAPATSGAAKLVPWLLVKPDASYMSPLGSRRCVATQMSVPTATRSGLMEVSPMFGPSEEKDAITSGTSSKACNFGSMMIETPGLEARKVFRARPDTLPTNAMGIEVRWTLNGGTTESSPSTL